MLSTESYNLVNITIDCAKVVPMYSNRKCTSDMCASVFTGTCRARRAANQRGFSLIEMMISMTLSLIVMAGATSLFSATIGVNSAVIKSATLNQDVRTVVDFMLRDIRRHGYFSGDSLITVNQFDTQWQVNAAENCVFTTYACTSVLRKTLTENGFQFLKRPGFSGKRESSLATRALTLNHL